MIKLDDIKAAIFDFDDTIAMHQNKDYRKDKNASSIDKENYYMDAYLYPNLFYEEMDICHSNDKVKKLLEVLREKDIKLYCVSGMSNSLNYKAKESFINTHYGNDIELIFTKSQESKLNMANIISRINDCKINEVLFVDDNEKLVAFLNKNEISAISVNDIDSLY